MRRAHQATPHWATPCRTRPYWATRGQAVVEFAVILPVLLMLVVAAFDFGRMFTASISLANAAREGARYCALHPGEAGGARNRLVLELGSRASLLATGTTTDCPTANPGDTITVEARAQFTLFTPIVKDVVQRALGTETITLRAPAAMVVWGA